MNEIIKIKFAYFVGEICILDNWSLDIYLFIYLFINLNKIKNKLKGIIIIFYLLVLARFSWPASIYRWELKRVAVVAAAAAAVETVAVGAAAEEGWAGDGGLQ